MQSEYMSGFGYIYETTGISLSRSPVSRSLMSYVLKSRVSCQKLLKFNFE